MIHCNAERLIARPIASVFALIADVESYPLYMPGFRAVRIISASATRLDVEQSVSLAGIRLAFNSVAEMAPPTRLEIHAEPAPLRVFRLLWLLEPRGSDETLVRAELTLAFRSRMFDLLAARLAPRMLKQAVAAFERRAAETLTLYRDHAR